MANDDGKEYHAAFCFIFIVASDSTPPVPMLYGTSLFYLFLCLFNVGAGRCFGYISETGEVEAKINFASK